MPVSRLPRPNGRGGITMTVARNSLIALILGLLAVGAAAADPAHGRGHSRDRGGPPGRVDGRGSYRGDGYEGPRGYGPAPGVVVDRPLGVDGSCGDFAACRYARPSYPGYPPGYAPRRNWRRGEFLPRDYWDVPELDPRRYRLRTPPPGYAWHGAGRDAYLVQRSTGLILDTVPAVR